MKPMHNAWLMVTQAMDMVDMATTMATTTTNLLMRMVMPILITGQALIIIITTATTTVTAADTAHTMAGGIGAVSTIGAAGNKKRGFTPFFVVVLAVAAFLIY